jgi:hypothetical protein
MIFLFELEDKKWFPNYLRQMQLNYIGWLVNAFKIYAPVVEILANRLKSPMNTICDLASGSGGPIHFLAETKKLSHCNFILTDKFPNHSSSNTPNLVYHQQPLDILEDQALKAEFYTIFNAFHHFSDDEKRQIVNKYKKPGLMIVEILEPNVFHFIKILFTTTIGQLLLAPFIKPFKWRQLFFTYLVPINIITITWDGLVSVLRSTKLEKEVQRIAQYLDSDFEIESHKLGPLWAKVNCIIIKEKDEKLD